MITKKSPEQRERELETFRANQEKKKQEKKQNIITCPNCKSKDVTFLQQDKKAFSVGKAVGGAVLTGGVGALAGFAGKKEINSGIAKIAEISLKRNKKIPTLVIAKS